MVKNIFILMVLFIIAGCSNDQPAAESTQPAKAATETLSMAAAPAHQAVSAQYNLVFFLDPNGRPCRMQDAILSEMAGELQGKVASANETQRIILPQSFHVLFSIVLPPVHLPGWVQLGSTCPFFFFPQHLG